MRIQSETLDRLTTSRGKIGELLGTLYEIKANGLEKLLDPIRKMPPRR